MLIYMSAAGSILIVCLLLLRLAAPVLPRRLMVILWDIALARLLVPLTLPAPVSLPQWVPAVPAGVAPAAESGPWLWIWTAGCVATTAVMVLLYRREWETLRDALPLDAAGTALAAAAGAAGSHTRILVSDRISTPVAAGLFRPRIVLPKAFTTWNVPTAAFALQHELLHIARRDNLQKLLMTAALCLHWFNPLVWIMRDRFDRDLERSCDESVIAAFGEDNRCNYAETLVELAAQKTCWSVCGNGFGRSAIHERVVTMMRRKPVSAAGWIGTVLALAGALTVFCAVPAAARVEAVSSRQAAVPAADAVYIFDSTGGQPIPDGGIIATVNAPEDLDGIVSIGAVGFGALDPAAPLTTSWTCFWTVGNAG